MHDTIDVLIVDDEPLMREALRVYLDAADGIRVVGEAADGRTAVAQASALAPDVVLMDLRMPHMGGVEATRVITALERPPYVLALTTFSTKEYVVSALRAGASGYLVKDTPQPQLIDAVRAIAAGESRLSPAVTRHVVSTVAEVKTVEPAPSAAASGLSERESDVLALLAEGLSNREIASELVVTESTVKSHLGRITEKLGVRDRVQLLIRATEYGLVRPSLRGPGSLRH